MHKQFFIAGVLALASMAACGSKSSDPPAADNTAKNARDRDVTPTADNAGGGTDLDLTQRIRKAVLGDGDLSMNAHNCKIVVQNGTVTLVGPVASDDERARVVQIATGIAGSGHVINQLEITK